MVEGYSDLLFFAEVLEYLDGRHTRVFIKQFNGKEELEAKLEAFVTPELTASKSSIACIVDADATPASTASRFARLLSDLTGRAVSAGSWTVGSPRVGLFVAPGGEDDGEIESLVWKAWSSDPANADACACVEAYRDCMKAAGFECASPHKGLVSSLLAIRNDDDPRLGPGARVNVFDFTRKEFEPLLEFMSGLG